MYRSLMLSQGVVNWTCVSNIVSIISDDGMATDVARPSSDITVTYFDQKNCHINVKLQILIEQIFISQLITGIKHIPVGSIGY